MILNTALSIAIVYYMLHTWERKSHSVATLCNIVNFGASLCKNPYYVSQPYDIVLRWAGRDVTQEYGELRYALRSLHHNPDVRKVHLVYAGTLPRWLNQERVHCVNEDYIIHLGLRRIQTSIEKCQRSSELCKIGLDLIPDLYERFVTMDDDFLLLRKHIPFFTARGIPIIPSYVWMSHRAIPFRKTCYRQYASRIRKKVFETKNRDRLSYDIFPRMCARLKHVHRVPWTVIDSNPSWREPVCATYWCNNRTVHQQSVARLLNYILRYRPCFVCINDDWAQNEETRHEHELLLQTFYRYLFPTMSCYELK